VWTELQCSNCLKFGEALFTRFTVQIARFAKRIFLLYTFYCTKYMLHVLLYKCSGRLALSVKSWPHNLRQEFDPSPVVPLNKEPSTQLMGQCCYRPRWPKNCDCALFNYVLYHAVESCSHASASLCFVCCDSCVVIARAFPQWAKLATRREASIRKKKKTVQ